MYSKPSQRQNASRQTVFHERTFTFSKSAMDAIRATCTEDNVHGLSSGRWKTNDGKSRKTQKGTLDLSRAGEIAVYTILSNIFAKDPSTVNWTVGRPDFSRRPKGQKDRGDIPIDWGWGVEWVEVKTTTNWGAHNLENCTRTAMNKGYTFQKQIWCKKNKCRVLTPTFDPNSKNYKKSNARKLVGCVGTYLKNGGAMITVSNGTFMLPVSQCVWARRRYYAEGDEDLKMVHYETKFI